MSEIKIKAKNKGKFTAYAKKKKLTKNGKITDKAVKAGLKSKNKKTRARANFARMARRKFRPLKKEK